jgi:type IV pilus assembly protein PilA
MHAKLQKLRQERADGDRGFTLIELLVVVVIIGVLVAIAIPVYLNYRKGAENKSAASDVRGAISAVEQYYTENANVYPATQIGALSTNMTFGVAPATIETATVSSGNTLSFLNVATYYAICGLNTDGGAVYGYNSSTAGTGSVKKTTYATLALCITAKGI